MAKAEKTAQTEQTEQKEYPPGFGPEGWIPRADEKPFLRPTESRFLRYDSAWPCLTISDGSYSRWTSVTSALQPLLNEALEPVFSQLFVQHLLQAGHFVYDEERGW